MSALGAAVVDAVEQRVGIIDVERARAAVEWRSRAHTAEYQRGAWRERALEAEARLADVAHLLDDLNGELYAGDDTAARLARVLDAPTPTIAPGQTWETVEAGTWRQAVVLYRSHETPDRPHRAGAVYWRIRSRRGSTIREDVLRRRWQLVQRAEVTP